MYKNTVHVHKNSDNYRKLCIYISVLATNHKFRCTYVSLSLFEQVDGLTKKNLLPGNTLQIEAVKTVPSDKNTDRTIP
jgi:hypothetical protein